MPLNNAVNYQTTQYDVIVGGANNTISNVGPGTAGQILQSAGNAAPPAYSTATYPSTAGTSGNVLTSDGTNFSSSGARSQFITVTGQLTSAQIKALHGTPIQVVAAPGSGLFLRPISIVGSFVYGGNNVFVAGAAQAVSLFFGTTTTASFVAASNITLTTAANSINANGSFFQLTNAVRANYENLALNLYNSVATEITGNANNDNVINYSLTYQVVAL